jgi:hypothetical protein
MVTRAIDRGEVPPGTDPQLLLHVVRAIVDARRLDTTWLILAVRTVIAGARAGTLERERRNSKRSRVPSAKQTKRL